MDTQDKKTFSTEAGQQAPGSAEIKPKRVGSVEARCEKSSVYLQCDEAHSVRALMDSPSLRDRTTESKVMAALDQFIDLGLMIRQGKQYLSLAVVRNGHSPIRS